MGAERERRCLGTPLPTRSPDRLALVCAGISLAAHLHVTVATSTKPAMSGSVTVEVDRAVLLRIMQIVTSAVRDVIASPKSLQVHSLHDHGFLLPLRAHGHLMAAKAQCVEEFHRLEPITFSILYWWDTGARLSMDLDCLKVTLSCLTMCAQDVTIVNVSLPENGQWIHEQLSTEWKQVPQKCVLQ